MATNYMAAHLQSTDDEQMMNSSDFLTIYGQHENFVNNLQLFHKRMLDMGW